MVSKQEIMGEQILRRVHIHNPDYGGIFSEITGAQGSGKTSVLLSFADYTMVNYPNEKIFMSECYNAPLQVFKLGLNRYQFLVKEGAGIIFRDRDRKLEEVDFKPTYFTNLDDMYDKAKSGKVNVVFTGDRSNWMELIGYLRGVGEWTHIYIDELGDISPSQTGGEMWKRINKFATVMKDVRKCMMNVHCNTQTSKDVDYRIRNKIMLKVFLPGAIVDSSTRIQQRAVDNLDRNPEHGNQAYLDFTGQFGVVTFSDIYKPIQGYHYEAHVVEPNA